MEFEGYFLKEKLYESDQVVIHRALRKIDNRSVVLKVLKNEYPTAEELAKFQHEYKITSRMGLEGTPTVYDLEKHLNGLMLVLEDFEGPPLKTILTEEKLDSANALMLALKIIEVLQQIHDRLVMHKDLNPANILWNPKTQKIKIIDFGVASSLSRERFDIQNPRVLEGTLPYISPEQTGRMNRGIDYRTDYYSFGVTLYQMLTGRLPFESQDPMEMVHAHIAKQPIPPSEFDPNIPVMLSNIVMKCMAKIPEERYQSAFGIKADLQNCLSQLQSKGNIELFELGLQDVSSRFQIPEKLYGREEEIKTLSNEFDRTCQGTTGFVLVTGSAGIGKSVLVHEINKSVSKKKWIFL